MTPVSAELDRRFRDAAATEHLLDVAYDLVDTPVGLLLVAATERGLCRIAYDAEPEQEVERLAHAFGVRVLRSARPIDPARRQLDEYFAGGRPRAAGGLQPPRAARARARALRRGRHLR